LRAADFFFLRLILTLVVSTSVHKECFKPSSCKAIHVLQKYDLVMKNKKQNTQPNPALNYLVVLLI